MGRFSTGKAGRGSEAAEEISLNFKISKPYLKGRPGA